MIICKTFFNNQLCLIYFSLQYVWWLYVSEADLKNSLDLKPILSYNYYYMLLHMRWIRLLLGQCGEDKVKCYQWSASTASVCSTVNSMKLVIQHA